MKTDVYIGNHCLSNVSILWTISEQRKPNKPFSKTRSPEKRTPLDGLPLVSLPQHGIAGIANAIYHVNAVFIRGKLTDRCFLFQYSQNPELTYKLRVWPDRNAPPIHDRLDISGQPKPKHKISVRELPYPRPLFRDRLCNSPLEKGVRGHTR